jgi:hypothetical protein
MADRDAVRALEALTPWDRPAFQADLALLSASVADASRAFAADVQVLSRLASQVPRCANDESGATPWTSFRQEVAVARQVSGQAAATDLRIAMRLTSVLPHTLHLLAAGQITVARARAFVMELAALDDELAAQLDCDLADVVAGLAVWRIEDEVRRAALALDPETATLRKAAATADRDVVLEPMSDGQACVLITGPAVPLTRWYTSLDERARALRQAGDPRNLAALRFDLAASTFPCVTHPPADQGTPQAPTVFGAADAGLRVSGVEAAPADCRMSRPVQAIITVPVETALGVSSEPAWLDGYGWLDAPSARLLLPDAELRQLSVDGLTGQVLDLAARDVRPPPTPAGARQAVLDMVTEPTVPSGVGWRNEAGHDPSEPMRDLVRLRDRGCDGPTQPRSRASTCDLDHDRPYPDGPTAAWNLVVRSRRTHQLKHYGWTPIRTAGATIWTSPAGQVVEVPRQTRPAPGIDRDRSGRPARLPDASALAALDTDQLTPLDADDQRPWLPLEKRAPRTAWALVDGSEGLPPF